MNWKTIEKDGEPKHKYFELAPYINCIVFACNPTFPEGGVIDTCRWDVVRKEWYKKDLRKNWVFEIPYQITHYIDDAKKPYEIN